MITTCSYHVYNMFIIPCIHTNTVVVQALNMSYFSNRPAPTSGPSLPRPNCAPEALREKELNGGLKRTIETLEKSKGH